MDARMGATGMEVSFTEFLPPDKVLFLSGAPVAAELRLEPVQERFWGSDRDSFMQMAGMLSQKTKTLRRPSWLRPLRRILWVHHHGPHTPSVEVPVIDFNSYGVIENVC